PDLSVKESRVSGEEGGSVTVQCLYSAAYQNTQKQWCRFKDKNCNIFKKGTSQNSAVQLSDDGRSSSVEIRGLKKSDAGWYWCSAGDLQVPVHISVTDPPPVVTETLTTTTHHVSTYTSVPAHISAATVTSVSSSEESTGSETLIYGYLLMAFLLLLVVLVIVICILRIKCKADNEIRTHMRSNNITLHTPTDEMAEDSLIYSTVSLANSSASKVTKQDVTYQTIVCKKTT
ncbi:polymeric immunoglobulin receptor-like, partial [Clarias magur]